MNEVWVVKALTFQFHVSEKSSSLIETVEASLDNSDINSMLHLLSPARAGRRPPSAHRCFPRPERGAGGR